MVSHGVGGPQAGTRHHHIPPSCNCYAVRVSDGPLWGGGVMAARSTPLHAPRFQSQSMLHAPGPVLVWQHHHQSWTVLYTRNGDARAADARLLTKKHNCSKLQDQALFGVPTVLDGPPVGGAMAARQRRAAGAGALAGAEEVRRAEVLEKRTAAMNR